MKQSYVIGIRIAREWYDLARFFKTPDPQIYLRGLMEIMKEREWELSEQHINTIIQYEREEMKESQDAIARLERVALDARIRDEKRDRKNTEVREWDGQKVIVAVSE